MHVILIRLQNSDWFGKKLAVLMTVNTLMTFLRFLERFREASVI